MSLRPRPAAVPAMNSARGNAVENQRPAQAPMMVSHSEVGFNLPNSLCLSRLNVIGVCEFDVVTSRAWSSQLLRRLDSSPARPWATSPIMPPLLPLVMSSKKYVVLRQSLLGSEKSCLFLPWFIFSALPVSLFFSFFPPSLGLIATP
jgi:hypothetical protein